MQAGHFHMAARILDGPVQRAIYAFEKYFRSEKYFRFFIALADFLQFSLGDRHFQRVDAAGFLLTDADAFHAADAF